LKLFNSDLIIHRELLVLAEIINLNPILHSSIIDGLQSEQNAGVKNSFFRHHGALCYPSTPYGQATPETALQLFQA
jgi:hypothetical protein